MNLIEDSYISFVNLSHRKDRLMAMKRSLEKIDIKAVRTPGMLPSDYTGDKSRIQVMYKRTPGAIGCHFSQVKIMEEALRQQKHAWVMEDDLVFCSDFRARLVLMEAFLDARPWDILWLGATFHINPPYWHVKGLKRDAETTTDPRFMRTYGAFCTYAYIVNRTSVSQVLGMLDKDLHLSMGIDWLMIQMQPHLQTFAFVPGSVKQFDNESDIGISKGGVKAITKFSGFVKLGPYWWQDKMGDFDPTKFNWHEARR